MRTRLAHFLPSVYIANEIIHNIQLPLNGYHTSRAVSFITIHVGWQEAEKGTITKDLK
jgi:hypothetical protein